MSDPPALLVDDLAFRYADGPEIGPLNLALGPGLHRLSGANGAGKSTLLRCIAADLEPTRGRVTVCGRDPVREVAARALVGHAPYPDDLPDFPSLRRLLRGCAAFRRCPDWHDGGLAERLALPDDLLLGHASAGQRRKAGLLAALVGDPPALLLDEPWAAIDAAAVDVVTELMESLREERIVLFTAHGKCPLEIDSSHALVSPVVRRQR